MSNWLRSSVFCFSVALAAAVSANETQQYCNDLYPADSYEPEERAQYIQECYEAYADEVQSGDESSTYYEGSVEDFVNDVAPEEDVQD